MGIFGQYSGLRRGIFRTIWRYILREIPDEMSTDLEREFRDGEIRVVAFQLGRERAQVQMVFQIYSNKELAHCRSICNHAS